MMTLLPINYPETNSKVCARLGKLVAAKIEELINRVPEKGTLGKMCFSNAVGNAESIYQENRKLFSNLELCELTDGTIA